MTGALIEQLQSLEVIVERGLSTFVEVGKALAPDPNLKGFPISEWTEAETAWMAGLLEGEGNFNINHGKYPQVRLRMTDRDVVERAAALMGTPTRNGEERDNPAWSPIFQTFATGGRAVLVMMRVLPYMGRRRRCAIAAALRARLANAVQKDA